MMRWGLISHWAKDESIGYKMINARAETITEKPSYRGLIRSKRCIVPASGFYEWQDTGGKGKQPYYIHADAGEYLPFAGLYDIWKIPEGMEIYSFTIITTQPTVNLQAIHNRMPVILEPDAEDVWLNPDVTDPQGWRVCSRCWRKMRFKIPIRGGARFGHTSQSAQHRGFLWSPPTHPPLPAPCESSAGTEGKRACGSDGYFVTQAPKAANQHLLGSQELRRFLEKFLPL